MSQDIGVCSIVKATAGVVDPVAIVRDVVVMVEAGDGRCIAPFEAEAYQRVVLRIRYYIGRLSGLGLLSPCHAGCQHGKQYDQYVSTLFQCSV